MSVDFRYQSNFISDSFLRKKDYLSWWILICIRCSFSLRNLPTPMWSSFGENPSPYSSHPSNSKFYCSTSGFVARTSSSTTSKCMPQCQWPLQAFDICLLGLLIAVESCYYSLIIVLVTSPTQFFPFVTTLSLSYPFKVEVSNFTSCRALLWLLSPYGTSC